MCSAGDLGCPDTGVCVLTGQYEVGEACHLDFADQAVEVRGTVRAEFSGGSFTVSAGSLVLDGGKIKSPGGLTQEGGDIGLFVTGTFSMGGNNARIDTSANAGGGSVIIEAGAVSIEGGASIVTDGGAGENCGSAGPVSISADSGPILLTGSGMAVQAKSSGFDCDGGFVELDAPSLRLEKGIDASGGLPSGINLLATTGDILIQPDAFLDARARGSDEDFGNDGGEVDLEARSGAIDVQGRIFVLGSGADGGGGEVSFDASDDVTIRAEIEAASSGTYASGGVITILSQGDVILFKGLDVSGGTQGDGGEIDIRAEGRILLEAGETIAISGGGFGAGFLDLEAGTLLSLDGDLAARGSRGGDGGFVDIQACEVSLAGTIDAGAAGRGLAGVIDIEAAAIAVTAVARVQAQPCVDEGCILVHMPSGTPTVDEGSVVDPPWTLAIDETIVPCCGNRVIDDGTAGTIDAGESCDDGNVLHCDDCSPSCVLEPSPACAPDGNECTQDCSPALGCVYEPVSFIPCADEPGGNVCTTDVCEEGICVHQEGSCDDGIACTLDRCDPTLGCQADPRDVFCDDGESCTIAKCDPANGDPGTGCTAVTLPDGVACDDDDYCTTGEICEAGACIAKGPPLNCNDGDSCTFDNCEPAFGCMYSENPGGCSCFDSGGSPRPAGFPCVDGNGCTLGDSCDGAGVCLPGPSCPDDGNPCTRDSCAFGTCFHTDSLCPSAETCIEGEACSDADACTLGVCRNGVCEATLRACSDGDVCTGIESCSPALGCRQVSPPPTQQEFCQETSLPSFLCYRVRRPVGGLSKASLGSVLVRDEFGSHRVNLRRRVALCVPASLAGQDPAAPERESWLQAHRWKRSAGEIPFRRLSGIAVENALGTSRIDIKKPDLGMVPAVLDLQEGGSSAVSSSVGNFSCYRISLDRGAPRVPAVRDLEVQDAFGTYRLDLSRPTRACSPADVNGLSPQAPGHPDRLVCYRVRRTRGASLRPSSEVASLDLLGAAEATVTRPTELCLPSWLGSLAP